jgi:hypothetical protein
MLRNNLDMKKDSTPNRQNGEAIHGVNDSSLEAKSRPRIDFSRVQIEWSQEQSRMTQMGGLAYFVNFLVATGLFDDLVESAPLAYESNNAPQRRDVLGAMLLSVLSGHTRYAHMSSLGRDKVDAGLLGMKKIPCEDSIRAALKKMVEREDAQQKTGQWLDQCFERVCEGSLEVPWVLDIDVTVKLLYGKQEGAVLGYNPAKPGRPSHAYHSFWVGHLRLCLGMQVRPGNETSGSFGLGALLTWLKGRPLDQLPEFVRGDIGYGTETWMVQLEDIDVAYLFKLKQTKGVKTLIAMSERQSEWATGLGGWQYCEAMLQLNGWTRARRVVIYRRVHHKKGRKAKVAKTLKGSVQATELLQLELLEEDAVTYEYAIYVTSLDRPAGDIRGLYNPRGDNENCYDELKNQWGWGGFTLKDLARSETMARFVALIYNWWSIYIKLVDEQVAREAITSRPMFLNHVAKLSTHQSTQTLVVFCAHVETERIKEKLEAAKQRLAAWATLTAEQLNLASVWKRIIAHILIYHKTVGGGICRAPPEITAQT